MPIRIEQPGATEAAARTGSIVGKGQRAAEERQRAYQEAVRKAEEKARVKAQETALNWELQKMQMNSQLAYQKEIRDDQRAMAADDLAFQRSLERIEYAKDLDFQYNEQERMRNIERAQTTVNALEKAVADKKIDPETNLDWQLKMYNANRNLEAAKMGKRLPADLTKLPTYTIQEQMGLAMQQEATRRAAGGPATSVGGLPLPTAANLTQQHIKVYDSLGFVLLKDKTTNEIKQVPKAAATAALKEDRYELARPSTAPVAEATTTAQPARPQMGWYSAQQAVPPAQALERGIKRVGQRLKKAEFGEGMYRY